MPPKTAKLKKKLIIKLKLRKNKIETQFKVDGTTFQLKDNSKLKLE